MSKFMKVAVIASVAANFLFGSATIISGTTQSVSFTSEPENTTVMIDGVTKCKTPCTLTLERGAYENVTFKKDGYKSKAVPLESSYNGTALLSIFWDLSTTDLLSGAVYEYAPNQYYIELEKGEDE